MKTALLFLTLLTLLSCSDRAGSTSEVDVEVALTGTVTDTSKQGISDVQIYLYSSGTNVTDDADTTLIDSTFSDTNGLYTFDSLTGGIYHIQANYEDSLFATKRNILYTEQSLTVDSLQLRGPGTLTGMVTFDANNKQGVLAYIPGTSYNAYTDSTGRFTITQIPADSNYSLVTYLYGYSSNVTKDITIKSLDTTILQPINLTPNLYPSGLRTEFDSISRTVSLQWNKLNRDDITGYLIFRKDSLLTALYPEQLNQKLITDTSFVDTLDETLFNQDDTITFEYRVKAQTKHDYTSFSEPAFIETFIKRDHKDKKTLTLEKLKMNEFQGTEQYTLHWEYTGLIDSIRIELTINGGDSWSEVTAPIKNKGWHTVKIPNIDVNGMARFRISNAKDSTLAAASSYFSIEAIDPILLKNGDFSAGFKYWQDLIDPAIAAECDYFHEEGKVRFEIPKKSALIYGIRFYQRNVPIYEGKRYRFSIEVRSSSDFPILVGLQKDASPWDSYFDYTFTADTAKRIVSYEFTSKNTNLESVFRIDLGADTGTVWLDNVSLELID